MAITFTDEYKLDKSAFGKTGAFDVILDLDSRLFIDPALLNICTIEEFKDVKAKVEKFFKGIIALVSHSQKKNDMYWKRADRMLTFTEVSGTCFGYSKDGTDGNAIGPILRASILETTKDLIEVGETDPIVLELLGVFQENLGCDRISDLLTYILLPEILIFTQRVVSQFPVVDMEYIHKGVKYNLTQNQYNHKPILLLPSIILSPLPVADCFDDIDRICMENERVRQEINTYLDLGRRKKISKSEIHWLMTSSASFRSALISAYKSVPAIPYDFKKDPVGEYSWYDVSKKYVKEHPLEMGLIDKATNIEVFEIVQIICRKFKSLVEENGLWELLYNNDKKTPKHERAAQQLFFGIADSYCTVNDLDLTRESNVGRGPVDFKLSKGASEKVVVEVKLTSNSQLKHGIETQLPIYMKQEKTQKAIYLIIDNGHQNALGNFYKFYNDLDIKTKETIPFIIVDGTPNKTSASKA